jgi:hypothetical protein
MRYWSIETDQVMIKGMSFFAMTIRINKSNAISRNQLNLIKEK